MTAWTKVRLDECCDIVAGATPSTSVDEYWGGDICWATPKDLSVLEGATISDTPRKLTKEGLESCAASILPVGSVLLSSRAPIGHVAINVVPMATNQGFKSLVPRPDRVHPKFLYWWLRTNRPYLESLGNGATFKEVSKAVVSRIELLLPALSEQRRIAEVLDRVEALRAKRDAALALLDSLNVALFLHFFGDPATNPKGWPMSNIGEVAEQVTDGEHATPRRASNGIALLSARNVRDGELDLSLVDYVDLEEYNRIRRRCDPSPGDVLISCSGTIGRVACVDTSERFSLVRSVALVRPKRSLIESKFLEHYLRTPALKAQMLRQANASSQANLFQGQIRKLPVFLPPLSLQAHFASRAAAVTRLRTAHRSSRSKIDALFTCLQHRAFRGEL